MFLQAFILFTSYYLKILNPMINVSNPHYSNTHSSYPLFLCSLEAELVPFLDYTEQLEITNIYPGLKRFSSSKKCKGREVDSS